MKNIRLRLFILPLFLLFLTTLSAQSFQTEIVGEVIESDNSSAVPYATVQVKNPVTKAVIGGMTTAADGRFRLTVDVRDFTVEVSFIGYETYVLEKVEATEAITDLGVITLRAVDVSLDEVEITGERSSTEFSLDKRIFHVGQDLSSTGASALEVLNNVPSVNVNIEGEISLRGSAGVQVLINGKPSVLASEEGNALGTLTADMIESVEVITNPSAKYDAEGTAGIINIVLKKEERKGINGSVSLNTGTPHNHSFGMSLNRRTEKFNLFSQLGVGYRELPNAIENVNDNLVNETSILTVGEEYRNEVFYNVILGTDYHINENNVLTLSGNFAYEVEDQPSQTDFSFVDASGTTVSEWRREEVTEATNPKYQFELNYKRDFEDNEDHDLIVSALGRYFGKDQSSEFTNTTISGEDRDSRQQTRTNFNEAEFTYKLDYTRPLNDAFTIETGAQYVTNDVSNDFAVSNFVNDAWLPDSGLTNIFNYDQAVLGGYGTGAYEGDKWGVKLGLRVENTQLNTLLENTDEANNQNYTNLFPSFHTSYKLSERMSVQGGYSRRVSRPRLWDLNPFFNIRNNFNIRVGNPDLQPEFSDSYEIGSIYTLNEFSAHMAVYHRYTTDVVERISTFENDVNTFMPMNIGTNRATGIEFNGKYSFSNWLSINGDANFNFFTRRGTLETTSFDFEGDQWSSKLTTKFKLPAGIDAEVTGQYQSRVKTVQSIRSDNLFADFGVRKKIWKGKAVVSVSVRDVFASRVDITNTFQPEFNLYSRRQRGRFITAGFSYGFGKGEAMQYSGQKRR